MKIRTCFVSNSSSSSFVLIGQEVDIKTLTPELVHTNKYLTFGKYLSDGQDCIHLTPEMLPYFQMTVEYDDGEEFTFYHAVVGVQEEGSFPASILDPKQTYLILNVECDYHSTGSLNALLERYATEADRQRFYRKHKLIRILDDSEQTVRVIDSIHSELIGQTARILGQEMNELGDMILCLDLPHPEDLTTKYWANEHDVQLINP